MATINITDASFEQDVLNSDKPVVIDFWAPWCSPCLQLTTPLEELSEEMQNDITIAKVNIDENPITPTKYGCRGIPFLLVFKNGEVVNQKVGAVPKSQLAEWIKDSIV